MKKSLELWQFAGFVMTALGGTILHFLYNLTNQNGIVAAFSAVNESTWEHMKLAFFPMFVFAIIQSFFFKEYLGFWCIKLLGILCALLLIPVLFYTYNGTIGTSPDFINIAIFFVSVAAAYFLEYLLFKRESIGGRLSWASLILLIFLAVLFVFFTYNPPNLKIFKSPTE